MTSSDHDIMSLQVRRWHSTWLMPVVTFLWMRRVQSCALVRWSCGRTQSPFRTSKNLSETCIRATSQHDLGRSLTPTQSRIPAPFSSVLSFLQTESRNPHISPARWIVSFLYSVGETCSKGRRLILFETAGEVCGPIFATQAWGNDGRTQFILLVEQMRKRRQHEYKDLRNFCVFESARNKYFLLLPWNR